MAPRRCCCGGPCLEFTDLFERPNSLDIGPDYEVCSGSFQILDQELVGTGELVILYSSGTPFNYLFTGFEWISGVTYEFKAYRGTAGDPCAGTSAVILKCECLAPDSGYDAKIRLELLGGEDKGHVEYQAVTWDSLDTLFLLLCIGENGVIAGRPGSPWERTFVEDEDWLDPLTDCSSADPSNLYFEIKTSGSADGVIREINYKEHFDAREHPDCPRCLFGTCFGDGDVPVGWQMTLSGIADGDCSECPSMVSAFVPIGLALSGDPHHPCEASFRSSQSITYGTTCPGPIVPPGIPTNAAFSFFWELDCTDPDQLVIKWTVAFNGVPLYSGPFEIERTYAKVDGVPPLASTLEFTDQPADVAVIGGACDLSGATLTVEVQTQSGCCYDPNEPPAPSLAVKKRPRPRLRVPRPPKISELPHSEHQQLIDKLRDLKSDGEGLGDTASRLISTGSTDPKFVLELRRFLKFYSCRRREACSMVNKQFP